MAGQEDVDVDAKGIGSTLVSTGSQVFNRPNKILTNFEHTQDIIGTKLLSKLYKYWTINVASRRQSRKLNWSKLCSTVRFQGEKMWEAFTTCHSWASSSSSSFCGEEDSESDCDDDDDDIGDWVYDDNLTSEEFYELFGESDDEDFEGF
ncbi:hypothetical protein DPMN_161663 [Dreissena polymorpha]|uniref:Uncharacterized protein n=1 Tax=Dreissena polymorpha TaxID=45954 RepID=A0A9D4ETF9_DREPO|nr:hypothetical protein DPMN_161663 [Dreissena polymorpha]